MRRKLAAVGGSYLIGLIFASIFFDFVIFLICGVILLIAVAIITAILTRKYDISAALLCCAAGITVFLQECLGGSYRIALAAFADHFDFHKNK